ncbi:MAG TPA: hypothetical protein VKB68_03090, partial [Stellaceae bacterium]|nr:hypothetical protein [Stellaceae bacterium]
MDALASQRGVTLGDTVAASLGATQAGAGERARRLVSAGWIALLLAILGFLVVYPVTMLMIGALTDTNPVVEGLANLKPSLANFVTVLANPNVHEALANSLIVCGGGTALALAIGLAFSWIVVRT